MKTTRFLCTLSILVASVLNLSACGQTGALYLPTPADRGEVQP
jgi:predicted small lipoprotein YifL